MCLPELPNISLILVCDRRLFLYDETNTIVGIKVLFVDLLLLVVELIFTL